MDSFTFPDWREYQHYKDRRPDWIKLHAKWIDDRHWRSLSDENKGRLTALWLLAARLHNDVDTNPELPGDPVWLSDLTGCSVTEDTLQDLDDKGFIDTDSSPLADDSDPLAGCKPSHASVSVSSSVSDSVSEKGEKLSEKGGGFDTFWSAYPRKAGKRDAEKAWKQTGGERPPVGQIVEKLRELAGTPQWSETRYIPYPATWLRRGGWADDPQAMGGDNGGPPGRQPGDQDPKEQGKYRICQECEDLVPRDQEHRCG